ncbi:hypothetical protein KVT40_009228 [Elsinoe batatas]|uniref:MYND-type domain-containing protein n=1 Tax=Elsinoe batatas TaxID=2601811 RepID=A0A8K0KVS8_9PEZI|nr:hypothetical protein KVT40_009228 [Elsinoe batatas]
MGLWGGGVFESEYQIDSLGDWTHASSVDQTPLLIKAAYHRGWIQCRNHHEHNGEKPETMQDNAKDEGNKDEDLEFLIYEDTQLFHPRFPKLVREWLDAGNLASIIKDLSPKKMNGHGGNVSWSSEQLTLSLVTVCAMQLGCTFPAGYLEVFGYQCEHTWSFACGIHQMQQAASNYINGKPYHFININEISLEDDMAVRFDPDLPALEDIPEPAYKPKKVKMEHTEKVVVEEYCFTFPPETCENCGSTKGHPGGDLRRCSACHESRYCFVGCQKWHWWTHRKTCAKTVEKITGKPAKETLEQQAARYRAKHGDTVGGDEGTRNEL